MRCILPPGATHLQQGEQILVLVLQLVPFLDKGGHQLLDVFLGGGGEKGEKDDGVGLGGG